MLGTIGFATEAVRWPGEWPGARRVPPRLMVRDISASLAFYEGAFGFTRRNVKKGPDGSILHAEAAWGDGHVAMSPEGSGDHWAREASWEDDSTRVLQVLRDDVDALFERAVAAGAVVKFPPTDTFRGGRFCLLVDPDGHTWDFATAPTRPDDGWSSGSGYEEDDE